MLSSVFEIIYILSIKGIITAFALVGTKKLLSKFLLHRWHYYLWGILWLKLLGFSLPSFEYSFDNYMEPTVSTVTSFSRSTDNIAGDSVSITCTLSIIWIIGVLILLLFYFFNYYRLHKRYKRSTIIKDKNFLAMADEVKNTLKLRRKIMYCATDNFKTPCVYGILKPVIFFPRDYELEPNKLEHVLLHEMVHIKKHHVFFKQICYLICIVHWFNPVLWSCLIKFVREQELYCDEYLLNYLDVRRHTSYADTVVHYMGGQKKLGLVTTGISPSFSFSYDRIKSILYRTRVTTLNILIYLSLTCLLVIAVFPEATVLNNLGLDSYFDAYDYELIETLGEPFLTVDPKTVSYLNNREKSFKYIINEEMVEFIYPAYEEDVLQKVKIDTYMGLKIGMKRVAVEKKLKGYNILAKGDDFLEYDMKNIVLRANFKNDKLMVMYLYSKDNYIFWNEYDIEY